MIKIASIKADETSRYTPAKSRVKVYMTIPQRDLISEFDIEKWRVRRHPKRRDTIEIYIDPEVLDNRKRFMFQLLFDS